jgi:hypothetical protein
MFKENRNLCPSKKNEKSEGKRSMRERDKGKRKEEKRITKERERENEKGKFAEKINFLNFR